jgi:hypothetical protein
MKARRRRPIQKAKTPKDLADQFRRWQEFRAKVSKAELGAAQAGGFRRKQRSMKTVASRQSTPRGAGALLPVVLPDVRPVEDILSPFAGFHDNRPCDGHKRKKQSYFNNHFRPPAMGGSQSRTSVSEVHFALSPWRPTRSTPHHVSAPARRGCGWC